MFYLSCFSSERDEYDETGSERMVPLDEDEEQLEDEEIEDPENNDEQGNKHGRSVVLYSHCNLHFTMYPDSSNNVSVFIQYDCNR